MNLANGEVRELKDYPGSVAKVLASWPAGHAWQPYSPKTYHAVGAGRIYIGDSGRAEIDVYNPLGSLLSTIGLDREPRPVSGEQLEAAKSRLLLRVAPNMRALAERNWAAAPTPTVFPYFGGLLVDAADRLWVKDYPLDAESPTRWTVLAENGMELGTVELPARFDLKTAGLGYVVGVWRDDLDVEHVQVRHLDPKQRQDDARAGAPARGVNRRP